MFYKVYLTSVFMRQYKYDLTMKWKNDWSSEKQGHWVPLVSSVAHVFCEAVCVLVSSAFTGQVWGLQVILQALGFQKSLIILSQNSRIFLSWTENGIYIVDCEVHVHEFVFTVCDFGSGDLIDRPHIVQHIASEDIICDRYSVKSVLLYFLSFFSNYLMCDT